MTPTTRPDHRVLVVEDELMIAMLFESILVSFRLVGLQARCVAALSQAGGPPSSDRVSSKPAEANPA